MSIRMYGLRKPYPKEFLTFSMCTVVLATAYTFSVLIPPSTAFASNNVTIQTANLSGFQDPSRTCSTWVGIAPEEGSGNNTDISCIEKIFEKCQPFDVLLGYTVGSMRVSIKGQTNDGACSLSIEHEIEMGLTNMTCMIPQTKMSSWTNWKRGEGLDAVEQIVNYCVIV
jgi:hypothetical protein